MTNHTSVIMPVRNGVRFIAEAIDSVLPQLARNDEIIIIDDVSTDDTRSVISRRQDPRVRVLDGLGRGVSSARNIGLAAADGEFIAFLDHDDLWPLQRHAVLLRALLADDKTDCAFGRIRLRMEHDAIMLPQLPVLEGQLAPNLCLGNALFRRRILELVGGFDEEMRFWEDVDYYVRLKEHDYRFVLCNVDALIYRRHSTNITCDVAGSVGGVMQLIRRKRARASSPGSNR